MESSFSKGFGVSVLLRILTGMHRRVGKAGSVENTPLFQIHFPSLPHDACEIRPSAMASCFSVPSVSSLGTHRYFWKTVLVNSFLVWVSSSKAFSSGGLSRVSSEPHEMEREECQGNMIVFLRILSFLVGSMWKIMSVSQECQLKSFLELDGKWINITFQKF